MIAIAGTGSIVYGRDAAGRTARAGGWGFAISDEGSGHWIGRRAISAILHARDQGLETRLTAMVLHAWKLTTIDDLVQQANSTPPPDFPRLFPIVLRAADEADPIARDLLADAGAKLAHLAAIVIRRLAPDLPAGMALRDMLPVAMPPVATTGSVFRQSPIVRQVFYNTLQASFPGIDVRQELADPVEGALRHERDECRDGIAASHARRPVMSGTEMSEGKISEGETVPPSSATATIDPAGRSASHRR